tara:strand:+ start:186 stop:1247 length:1062 start_codon:yes stop_codon:yes gene_type:complete
VFANGKYHQPKLSLRTRNYLEAVQLSASLAIKLKSLSHPSVEDVKVIYSDFRGHETEESRLLKTIDIDAHLNDLAPKSRLEYRSCWLSFVNTLSDAASVASIRQNHIEDWKQMQTCAPTTLKKKLRLLSSCFQRAHIEHDVVWFRLAVKSQSTPVKRPMRKADLYAFLEKTEQFRGKREGFWKYYIPRIAALTGCRLNEVAQLRVEDIYLGAEPMLSINDEGKDKRLKNEASRRDIPISLELQALLIPLVQAKPANARLFPDLPYKNVDGYVSSPSKWFSRVFSELGIKECSFHSIRHYVVTELFNLGCQEELIASLVGHSVGRLMTGKSYLSGFTYANKLKAISLLSLQSRL